MPKKVVNVQKVRQDYAEVAYRAFARAKGINKEFSQLDAESKEAWCKAGDELMSSFMITLDQEEMFVYMLKLAMRDALTDDNITQLKTRFQSAGGFTGECRIIIAPERMSMNFAEPLGTKQGD